MAGLADGAPGTWEPARDHFALFGLARDFRIDGRELDSRFRALQVELHPDRFASAGDAERRRSLELATRVNEAYQTLKQPLARARYLIGLLGSDKDFAHDHTALPADFLIAQMELREAVADAAQARDLDQLDRLRDDLDRRLRAHYEELAAVLERAGSAGAEARAAELRAAEDRIRRLMFEEKLLADIGDAEEALDD